MLKRQKTDKAQPEPGPPRILVVDDNADAGRLVGKVLRRAGFEVAEVSDHQVALVTLTNEPDPIRVVVASFSTSGTSACLKLLDALRHSPDEKLCTQRIVLVLDGDRQRVFAWQSGADEVLLRPYFGTDLIVATRATAERRDKDRPTYRRQQIDALRSEEFAEAQPAGAAASAPDPLRDHGESIQFS